MIVKAALLYGLLLTLGHAAEDPAAYRFSRAIIRQDNSPQALLAVPFDAPIYAASTDGFSDLRLIDQDGVETPYWLQKIADQKTVIQALPSRSETILLEKNGTDGISVTVKLAADAAPADGLSIVTPQHDFEYTLQIQGSVDGQTWQLLDGNAAIYDYSRYMAIAKRDISLPSNTCRYFKIIIANAKQTRADGLQELTRTLYGDEEVQRSEQTELHNEPLHIGRIDFWHNQAQTLPAAERQFVYPMAAFQISQEAGHKTTVIDISAAREPLTGFSLQIQTANFNRQAQVQIALPGGGNPPVQTIGDATLQALHFKDINHEQTLVAFPERRQSHYRIVIDNQDNPPLTISAVNGIGHGYQLLFLPQADQSYRLQYGNAQATTPHYDTAPIQELLRLGYSATVAALGPEIAGPPVTHRLDLSDISQLLDSRWFLGAAISLMVLVLAWSLYRLGKRVGELPGE